MPECRASIRHACNKLTLCRSFETGSNIFWMSRIASLSTTGATLLLGRSFDTGTLLAIELDGEDFSRSVLARIIHTRQMDACQWLIGCRFETRLTEEELETLLHNSVAG